MTSKSPRFFFHTAWPKALEKHIEILFNFYKITKIVRALWLAERSVCTRVCKHGCDVKMFCFSHANHASTNLKKFSSRQNATSLLNLPIPSSAETWKIVTKKVRQFYFAPKLTFEARKIRILESIFLQNKNWLREQDFVDKTLRLVRISLLISAIQRGVLRFFVSGLHNCLKFSQPLSCLYQAMQTRKTFSIA